MTQEPAYKTVKIPTYYAKQVDTLIGKHGFTSRAEVVKHILRIFFQTNPIMVSWNPDGSLIIKWKDEGGQEQTALIKAEDLRMRAERAEK